MVLRFAFACVLFPVLLEPAPSVWYRDTWLYCHYYHYYFFFYYYYY